MPRKKPQGNTVTAAPDAAPVQAEVATESSVTEAHQQPSSAPMSNGRKDGPAHVVRYGRVKVTLWLNHSPDGPWYSIVPGRIYKEEATGNFKTASSFGRDDCLALSQAMVDAWKWVNAQLQAHYHDKQQPAPSSPSDDPIPF